MTIKVKLDDKTTIITGESYKPWHVQIEEYCRTHSRKIFSIHVSNEPWIGYGGLKWCSEVEFQLELETEGKGRDSDDFHFGQPTDSEWRQVSHLSI